VKRNGRGEPAVPEFLEDASSFGGGILLVTNFFGHKAADLSSCSSTQSHAVGLILARLAGIWPDIG
jgi:hypothetical protein